VPWTVAVGFVACRVSTRTRVTVADWFGFAELGAQLRLSGEGWLGRLEVGGLVPFGALGVERNDAVVYRQGLGVVAGVAVGIAPSWAEVD